MKSTAVIALGLLILATSTLQQDNFCKHGFCDLCGFGTDGTTRSCASCRRGTQTLVLGSTALAAECVDNVSIPNCKRAAVSTIGSTLQCDECARDHYGSTNASCVPVTTKIPNCWRYASLTTCSICDGGHFLDATKTTCTKVPVEIPDCDLYTALGLQCSVCKKGFRPAVGGLTCVAEAANIGCNETTGVCTGCRSFHWAVDFATATGQKCEYSSRTLGFFSVIAVFIFSIFFN